MEKLFALLNKEVANLGVLYIKLHSFHWFVKGNHFFTLHEKFEELYDEVTEHLDEVAERILTLEGRPAATLKEYLELASIKEATGQETEKEMIQAVIDDFTLISDEMGEGIELAESLGDEVTADLFTGIRASLQKHVWMFKALLG